MTLFIHLQIKPIDQIQFQSEWVESVKTAFPEALIFEGDSHSEPYTIHHGINFLKDTGKVMVLLECSGDEKLGATTPIIEKVLRSKYHSPLFFLKGENERFEKLAKVMKREVLIFEGIANSIERVRNYLRD